MTREEAIANLEMILVAFVDTATKEQRKLINDTFDVSIKALEQEQKIGYWKTVRKYFFPIIYFRCSLCGNNVLVETNYCPNCGARMIGGKEA